MPTSRRTFIFGAAATAVSSVALRGTAIADTGARVVTETQVGTRILDLKIDSPALEASAFVRLLVPAGWSPGPGRSWPVLYLLHGAGDDYTSWTRSTDVVNLTQNTGMLVVMPSAGRGGFYSDWVNHGAGGAPRWETFHMTELRQIVERSYGASNSRVIAGLSMGGFGALSYAARHPGLFRAAASYSGVIHTRQSPRAYSLIQGVLVREGFDPLALWGDPNVNAATWAAHNPYDLAPQLLDIPLYVSCGDGKPGQLDPPGSIPDFVVEPVCRDQSAAFVQQIRQLGGNVTSNLYAPGTHSWGWWQRELHSSFPLLTRAAGL
jgi:diacylglycerol O-acyltransferase/trehalose O-mycolyltransferase